MQLTSKQHYSLLRLYDAVDTIEQIVPLERKRTSMQRRKLLEKAHEAFTVHCPKLNIQVPRLSHFYNEEQFLDKRTPTLARQLTEQDYVQREGSILTIEGPALFRPGDYLGRDRKSDFPIRRETIEGGDYVRTSDLLQDSWAYYQSIDSRQAAKQDTDFTRNAIAFGTDMLRGYLFKPYLRLN